MNKILAYHMQYRCLKNVPSQKLENHQKNKKANKINKIKV